MRAVETCQFHYTEAVVDLSEPMLWAVRLKWTHGVQTDQSKWLASLVFSVIAGLLSRWYNQVYSLST